MEQPAIVCQKCTDLATVVVPAPELVFFIDFLNVTIAFFLFEWCFNMVAFVLQGILYQILEG